jgi:hypothetical protein
MFAVKKLKIIFPGFTPQWNVFCALVRVVLGRLHILRDDQYYSDKGFVLTCIQVFNKGTDILKELFEFVHSLELN